MSPAPAEIEKAAKGGLVKAVKYYPAGATTNSDSGVTDLRKCDAALEAMDEVSGALVGIALVLLLFFIGLTNDIDRLWETELRNKECMSTSSGLDSR